MSYGTRTRGVSVVPGAGGPMEPKKMERNDSGVVPIPGHRDESPPRKIARTSPGNSRLASGSYSLRKRLWRKIGFK